MNILAIAAHPDDVEFMCAGTLLKYRAQGHQIFIALVTSGNTGSNHLPNQETTAATREAEALEAAEILQAQVRFMRFDDEGIQDSAETRRAILTAIRWANPDIIFTNPQWDGSTDHAHVGKLVADCLMIVGGKLHPADLPPIDKHPALFYWDTAAGLTSACKPYAGFGYETDGGVAYRDGVYSNEFQEPEAYVDISSVMDEKIAMLEKHRSQFAWMDTFQTNLTESCKILARMRGIQMGCKYAEAFTGHRLQGYLADYKLLP